MSEDLREVPSYERDVQISPEHELIAEELVAFWLAVESRPLIAHELTDPMGSRLGGIEARLKRLTDRERTILHLATGRLQWKLLEPIFGRLGGVALGCDAMLREYPRRAEGKDLDQLAWLQLLNIMAEGGNDHAMQILADIGRDALKDLKGACASYARTRMALVGSRA